MRPCLKRKSWVLFLNIYLVVESVTIPPNETTRGGGEACLPLGKWRPSPLYSSGFVLNPGKMIRGRKALETSTQLQSCLDDHWSGPRAGTHGPLFLHLLPGVQVTLEKPGMATVGTYLWPHRVRPLMRTLTSVCSLRDWAVLPRWVSLSALSQAAQGRQLFQAHSPTGSSIQSYHPPQSICSLKPSWTALGVGCRAL